MEEPSKDGRPVPEAPKSQDQSPGFVRKKHRMNGQRICRVCGDKAVAHNFDVITCESCKTFFRRNAHRSQKECAFEGKCEITVNTRRFCPACRLKKCFVIGMRADMILDEAERKARMDKIAENRRKRKEGANKRQGEGSSNSRDGGQNSDSTNCTQTSECDSSSRNDLDLIQAPDVTVSLDDFPDLLDDDVPDFLSSVESVVQSPQSTSVRVQGQSVEVQTESVSNGQKVASSFQPVPPALLPSDPDMYWRQTDEEKLLLTQLATDYKEKVLEHLPPENDAVMLLQRLEDLNMNESLGHLERFASNLITFMKRIPDFCSLDMNDQLTAVKGNVMRCFMVKSAVFYSEEREAWLKERVEIPLSTYVRATQEPELMTRYADFCCLLKRILTDDYIGYALLNVLMFLEPQAAGLCDRQTINTLHDKYAILLKHHLESQYSYLFANQYLEAIWERLHESKHLAADWIGMFHNWKDFVGPLMAEILDQT